MEALTLHSLVVLFFIHFITDFVMQSDWQAKNKSSNFKALGLHSLIYSLPFLLVGWKFALLNGCCHFVIDGITSRITKYFWNKGQTHNFFVVIGFDQFLHISLITWSYFNLL